MATNDMGPGPLKKARRLVKKITKKVTKGTFLDNPKNAPGEKNNPFAQNGGATKKYAAGGMMETESCGKPGKPSCRKKFKSKGKSKETKGSILGTLGAIAGGIGGYAAYKKLKEQQKGGAIKGNFQFNKDGSLKTFESERAKEPKQGGYLNKDDKYNKIREDIEKRTGKKSPLKYKTGGMVNSNAKITADNTPGSKGVKSGVNPKAAASKVARGKVGGTSTAPKGAFPKAKMKGSKKSY
jgi:hypothetical protein